MSNGFNIGGAPIQMARDTGTAGAVQGFRVAGITQGPRLATALSALFRLFGQDGAAQISQAAPTTGTQLYLRVSAADKLTALHLRVSGAWKLLTFYRGVGTVWK
jgi:hypothetical protein